MKVPKEKLIEHELLKTDLNRKLVNFITDQVKLSKHKRQSLRFSFENKLFAYNIYSKSRAAYRVLRTLMALPSERTLRRFVEGKITKPGINQSILNGLAAVLKDKPLCQRTYALVR